MPVHQLQPDEQICTSACARVCVFRCCFRARRRDRRCSKNSATRRSAVLFATSSFWQGVDVPGEQLSCVIVDRLPFAVPCDPIVAARVRALQEDGRNAFAEYQVPEAVLALKQGFGRLIRSRTDRGVLAILDNRIQRMQYGKIFMESLPEYATTRDIAEVERFMQNIRCTSMSCAIELLHDRSKRLEPRTRQTIAQRKSMFQVSVDETFSAGHALRGYKGKCENVARPQLQVRVTLEGPQLDSIGLLYDFAHLKRVMREIDRRRGSQVSERSGAVRRDQSFGGKSGQVFLRRNVAADERSARRRADRAASRSGRRTRRRRRTGRRSAG